MLKVYRRFYVQQSTALVCLRHLLEKGQTSVPEKGPETAQMSEQNRPVILPTLLSPLTGGPGESSR
jgi:hypothetical protein